MPLWGKAVTAMKNTMTKTKKIALAGLLAALAFGLSYIEFLLPFDAVGIPGFKLGLANLAVMLALYRLGSGEAAAVSGVRLVLSLLLFGSVTGFLYSVAGAVLSLAGMIVLKRTNRFGVPGVSVAGGVLHNAGQTLCAMVILGTAGIVSYLPLLLITGAVTGAVNGGVLFMILKRIGEKKHE